MCGEANFRTNLAEMWLGAVFYGIYIAFFGWSVYICLYVRPHNFFLIVITAMFALDTLANILAITSTMVSPDFVARSWCNEFACIGCEESQTRVDQIVLSGKISVTSDFLGVVVQLLGDGLIIYRAYILWQKNVWVIVLPILTLIGYAVSAFWTFANFLDLVLIREHAHNQPTPPPQFLALSSLYNELTGVYFIFIFATNVFATFLIVYRVIRWTRDKGTTSKRYHRAAAMVIESGAIYAISLVFNVVASFDPKPHQLLGMLNGISGEFMVIIPTLIVIWIGHGKGTEQIALDMSNDLRAVPQITPAVDEGIQEVGVIDASPDRHPPESVEIAEVRRSVE
ncbi:hypothetical protein JAAARDRAFT_55166 [Jaapia argillacea MUCL 33604]|uniref:G-protein coupled receptors family 1 profile domain-containing protein n=1 Tax=Jaapia argillacea MUCL 33604 TaxID=933084 RepID=A0A067QEB2_9AGAM|nr:hypothetical protein JAAARDRAFT_55166 [Jaapia argillacea MUCL 33604]